MRKAGSAILLSLLLIACAGAPPPGADPQCQALLDGFEARVEAAGVRDAEATRLPGFPHLRIDRFLASFRDGAEGAGFAPWHGELQKLGEEAIEIEHENLPRALQAQVRKDQLLTCAAALAAADLASPARQAAIRGRAMVPDDYLTAWRVAGLYPLTRIPVAWSFQRWQKLNLGSFAAPPPASALFQAQYRPLDDGSLAARWAPAISLGIESPGDWIGRPIFAGGRRAIDAAQPVLYWRESRTRYRGEVLRQFVYTMWFSERPARHAFDLLSGPFDAVIWRVTLRADGSPLAYDSIHSCGCYHLFFPVSPARARQKPLPGFFDDPYLAPRAGPRPDPGERIELILASGSHYLLQLALVPRQQAGLPLPLETERQLRSLPDAGVGRRSLFGPDGILPGSARSERFLLWPMGIASAGAMRQWGRHATAFVGRRHFDEPFLFEQALEQSD